MNRILFVNGQVFDGTGTPPVPADVAAIVRRSVGFLRAVTPGAGAR